METTLYAVIFNDGRIYRINCRGRNQKKRFWSKVNELRDQIKDTQEITSGIHTITEFEMLKQ